MMPTDCRIWQSPVSPTVRHDPVTAKTAKTVFAPANIQIYGYFIQKLVNFFFEALFLFGNSASKKINPKTDAVSL
jgi:large-conductance mechanosensitive channel